LIGEYTHTHNQALSLSLSLSRSFSLWLSPFLRLPLAPGSYRRELTHVIVTRRREARHTHAHTVSIKRRSLINIVSSSSSTSGGAALNPIIPASYLFIFGDYLILIGIVNQPKNKREKNFWSIIIDGTSSMMTDMWIVWTRIGPDDTRTGRYCWTALKSSD
jgi:hypothetical protein